jgi:hypothetical protein
MGFLRHMAESLAGVSWTDWREPMLGSCSSSDSKAAGIMQAQIWSLSFITGACWLHCLQAHFSAPSSERRKLMSAPLSTELRNKHQVHSFPAVYASAFFSTLFSAAKARFPRRLNI